MRGQWDLRELRYKLIVSDLDGTLLNSDVQITQRTLCAIQRYQSLGGLFTYATGRSEESTRKIAEQTGIKIPGIVLNGAKVVSHLDGYVIFETFLDGESTKKAFAAFRKLHKNVIIYRDDTRYIAEFTEVIDKYLQRVRHGVTLIENIDQVIGDGSGIRKLLVIDPAQEEELIVNTAKPIFGDNYNCIKSDPEYYEFLAPGTSKGCALAALTEHLQIKLSETAAIGDHLNDISMIEAAGLGVAVANAEREVLATADYITESNNEDGVASLIEKVISGEPLCQ